MSTTTATRPATQIGHIGHIMYAKSEWNDAQRAAHAAAVAISDAMHALMELRAKGVISSSEPATRAYLAWIELEREIAPLFAEEEAN